MGVVNRMRIDDIAKQKTFRRYINKNGYGVKRAYAHKVPASAIQQMKHKPYGREEDEDHAQPL